MEYRKWFYDSQKKRHIFLIDIQPFDREEYGICYGWLIFDNHTYLQFRDNFGVPTDWQDTTVEQDYFSKLTKVQRKKMFFDLFEKIDWR